MIQGSLTVAAAWAARRASCQLAGRGKGWDPCIASVQVAILRWQMCALALPYAVIVVAPPQPAGVNGCE